MQNVNFLIRRQEQSTWLPIIREIEKSGYGVGFTIKDAKTTVVLSGTYLNPIAIKGRKILIAHPQEWGSMWPVIYKPILEEYYDQVIAIDRIPLDRLMDTIGGIIETAKPGVSHREHKFM